MKKQLFFASSILVSGAMCAQIGTKTTATIQSKIPAYLSNKAVPYTKVAKGYEATPSNLATVANNPVKQNNAKIASTTEVIVGTTYYDLQSNSSVADRIVVNADGSIATCWTMSQDASGAGTYPDRGTGYNYFNGTTWGPQPTTRIESARVGWGNVVNTRTGKELILSHDGGASASRLASRSTKGTGTFSESTTLYPSATTAGNFWPRMVSSGDTVYAIANTYFVTGGIQFGGLNGAVVFSRSTDAGATWDIVNQIPAGLTSATYLGFGGDSYAIAAKGATVAIVAGDSGKDLTLSKSTDGGVTWTASVVLKFPLTKWDPSTTPSDINGDNVVDTVETNDGNLAVGLDANSKAYVFYGRMRIKSADPLSTSYNYFPGTDGLMMWNESMAVGTTTGGVIVAGMQDLYQQGTIFFPATPTTDDSPWGQWGCSLTSYPSVAFDAANNMYLSYSSIVDSLAAVTSNSQYKLVRHVYLQKSTDGGATWTDPCDVVGIPNGVPYEGIFASMAKRVDGNVHLIYQRDLAPGNGVPPASGTNPDQTDNTATPNDIIYLKIPVGDIGSCPVYLQGVNELASSISNLNFYPNPTSNNGTITLSLNESAKVNVAILNAVGQTVYSTSLSANAGSNKLDINLSNLTSGLYFYQVQVANKQAVTQKFVIEK